jgi:hypothetical protein
MAISGHNLMKGNQIKRHNPKTAKKHEKLLAKCQKTTLQRVRYSQDENGKAVITGTEVLASHSPVVCQEVRKMGLLPVDRVAYKKKHGKSFAKLGFGPDGTQFYPVMNNYSKDSVNGWNEKSKK